MAEAPERYHHLPFSYSGLFDLGYEAVGVSIHSLEVGTGLAVALSQG